MTRNTVLIKTENSIGTGVLYPCSFNSKDKEIYKSFLVITNTHVINDFETLENKDVKDYCQIKVYDDFGKLVEKSKIKHIYFKADYYDYDNCNDIAALLVCFDETVLLTVENKVYEKELINREILFTDGFPGILSSNKISQRVQLKGLNKELYPIDEKIGMYQIEDDYHWYNELDDYRILQGFSGGPVYIEKNNTTYLIGINQSIVNIKHGENPFKTVFYVKINHIIEYLYKIGAVLYRKDTDNSYKVEWIAESFVMNEIRNYSNNPTLLLLGGSGAGKSSLSLDFSYSRDLLCAVSDGQTTRTNVIYECSIDKDINKRDISIKILSKKKFISKMELLAGCKYIITIFEKIIGIKHKDFVDDNYYLKKFYYYLEDLLEQSSNSELIEEAKELKNKIDEILFFDKTDIFKLLEKKEDQELIDINMTDKKIDVFCIFIKILINTSKINDYQIIFEQNNDRGNYKNKIIESSETVNYNYNYIKKYFDTDTSEYSELTRLLIKDLFEIKGFFSLTEFNITEQDFLDILEKDKNREFLKFSENGSISFYVEEYYDVFYDFIRAKLNQEMHLDNNLKVDFNLSELSQEDKSIISKSLQVTKEGLSWTGVIDNIYINDRVASSYALMLKELNIRSVKIVDTCGLDHVTVDSFIVDTLYNLKYSLELDTRLNINANDYSVLFVKKLDSSKPDELVNIIPQIIKVLPQAPIYTVFSGVDIYFSSPDEIKNINWTQGTVEDMPKVVKYIVTQKNELLKNVSCREERKNIIYQVLKNNITPYYGKGISNRTEFSYYSNNQKYLKKLLCSISSKESKSYEYVDFDSIYNDLISNRKCVEDFLKKVFERASLTRWEGAWPSTAYANFRRIAEREENKKEAGYWGKYRHMWYQLFEEAYYDVSLNYNGYILAEISKNNNTLAVENEIIQMCSDYIGNGYTLGEKINIKHEFTRSIMKMYELGAQKKGDNLPVYQSNPFKETIIFKDNKEKIKYLNNITNFAAGFEFIKEELVDRFIHILVYRLKKSNNEKIDSLWLYNEEIKKELNSLLEMFYNKFGYLDNNYYVLENFVQKGIKKHIEAYLTELSESNPNLNIRSYNSICNIESWIEKDLKEVTKDKDLINLTSLHKQNHLLPFYVIFIKSKFSSITGINWNSDYSPEKDAILKSLGENLLRGLRPFEGELLLKLISAEQSYIKFDEFIREYRKNYSCYLDDKIFINHLDYLHNNMDGLSNKGIINYSESKNSIKLTDTFLMYINDEAFKSVIKDICNISIINAKELLKTKTVDNRFALYEQYTRKNICFLMDSLSLDTRTIFGSITIENETFENETFIFVNYNNENERYGVPVCSDKFKDDMTFIWESTKNRTQDTDSIKKIINSKKIHLFISKYNNSNNYLYYLGLVDIIGIKDSKTYEKDKEYNTVTFEFGMKNRVRADFIKYLES